mmetsp:Transcript_26475/g.61757  ORF Transcript_26475/g.61757 Transcript_26475/m.61757 type:complete len:211 (-) Transcript_26475:586-1218(-)
MARAIGQLPDGHRTKPRQRTRSRVAFLPNDLQELVVDVHVVKELVPSTSVADDDPLVVPADHARHDVGNAHVLLEDGGRLRLQHAQEVRHGALRVPLRVLLLQSPRSRGRLLRILEVVDVLEDVVDGRQQHGQELAVAQRLLLTAHRLPNLAYVVVAEDLIGGPPLEAVLVPTSLGIIKTSRLRSHNCNESLEVYGPAESARIKHLEGVT